MGAKDNHEDLPGGSYQAIEATAGQDQPASTAAAPDPEAPDQRLPVQSNDAEMVDTSVLAPTEAEAKAEEGEQQTAVKVEDVKDPNQLDAEGGQSGPGKVGGPYVIHG